MRAACCCGACSVELAGRPVFNAVCHCENCKRRTGSAFGWSVYFRDEDIGAAKGPFQTYLIRDEQVRYFCGDCGTTVYWTGSFQPGRTGVAAGCLPPEMAGAPTISAQNAGRCLWVGLPDGVRAVS